MTSLGFVLTIVGLMMIVSGAKGTYSQLGSQVVSDFTGPGNFTYWIVSIGAVGSVGYIDSLRAFSRLFMTLILVAMVLSNKGFFAKLTEALKQGPVAPQGPAAQIAQSPNLTGPGLTGTSNAQGENSTSTPTGQNWMTWINKNFPNIGNILSGGLNP